MSNETPLRSFRVLAIVDDINACECCGRSNLQKTVAIENLETGEIKYFGTSCALQPAKGFALEKAEMNSALADFKQAQYTLHFKAGRVYRERGGKRHNVMVFDKKLGRDLPESHLSDRPLYESILKELGSANSLNQK